MYHADPAIHSLSDLNGRTFAVSLGFAYWEWLKHKYGLTNVREIPVSGDLGLFRMDQKMVQQGLFLFLPARMNKAGIETGQFRVPDLGYRPYETLFTTDAMIKQHPDLVRNVVDAARAGWQAFAADPSKIKPQLLAQNSQIEPEIHDIASQMLIADLLPQDRSQLGCMTDARWQELSGQLQEANIVPQGYDIKSSYTLLYSGTCR